MSATRKGTLYCILSGAVWGLAGCCGQYLFDTSHWDVDFLIPLRVSLAGAIMLLLARKMEGSAGLKQVFAVRRNVLDVLIFGVLGIGLCQYSYYVTIAESNATTATVLCYLGPVMIILWVALRARKLPSATEVLAVACAVLGTFLLATHGDPTSLALSEKALFWGIISAVATAIYTIQPKRLASECGPLSSTGWGMIVAGIFLTAVRQPWAHVTGSFDATAWLAFAVVVLLGSVASFGLYFSGMLYVGPTRASILCATEPLVSTILSVVWLRVAFLPMDYLGFALVISTIFILAIPVKGKNCAAETSQEKNE